MTDQLSFWKNKPATIAPESPVTTIKTGDELMKLVSDEIENSKIKLDYQIINNCETDLQPVADFINQNYMQINSQHMLTYSLEMIRFFLGDPETAASDSLVLVFYQKSSNTPDTPDVCTQNREIAGVVCGSKHILRVRRNDSLECMDINFLCVARQLRNMHVSSYMINVITRECVERLGVICAGYTTSATLNIPHFSKKYYYHRLINIDKTIQTQLLSEELDTQITRKVYNSFNYQTRFKQEYTLEYYNTNVVPIVDPNVVSCITQRLQQYSRKNYDVYFEKSLREIQMLLDNPDFHVFLFRCGDQITDFVSFFDVNTLCLSNGASCRNGYMYYYFFSKNTLGHKGNVMEMIAEYCYKHSIFEMLTVCDPFGLNSSEYKTIKLLRGTGSLNYYMYNMQMHQIENENNGLVTI